MSAYSKTVWRHFNEPKNVGAITNPDVEGHAGGRHGGPFMHLSARIRGKILEEVRFQTYGCAPAVAAGSVLTEAIAMKSLGEAAEWDEVRLTETLGGLPEDKKHCAQLAIDALRDLLQNAGNQLSRASEESP